MGAVVSVIIAPVTLAIGYGLTYIKDRCSEEKMLPGNVKKVTNTEETNKTARIVAGIFTFGLTELMNHKNVSEEYFFEDEYIGSNEEGKKKYEESLNRTKQIREEVARREREEAVNRQREEAARREREAERQAREEVLRLERARIQSKSVLEEATNIYQQAEALSSLELKLEQYEIALSKCEKSCASCASEEAFNTLNKIFESCLKHDAHDEAEDAVQIVRKYFPSEAVRLQDALVNQQKNFWSPDYESIARRQQEQQEQNRTVMIIIS